MSCSVDKTSSLEYQWRCKKLSTRSTKVVPLACEEEAFVELIERVDEDETSGFTPVFVLEIVCGFCVDWMASLAREDSLTSSFVRENARWRLFVKARSVCVDS